MKRKSDLCTADDEEMAAEEESLSSELVRFIEEAEGEIEQGRTISIQQYAKRQGISL